jgi:hypothetical protein
LHLQILPTRSIFPFSTLPVYAPEMQPPEIPAAPGFPPPPGAEPEAPKRSRKNAIVLGAAIGLLIIGSVATLAIIGGDDGPYPDSLDGLERIRSSAADTFEEGLASFETGGISLSGAMYGDSETAVLIVERIEGPEDEIAFVPLEPTFDGGVIGFENSGAGEIDEDEKVRETSSGFEIICAELHATVGDPTMPAGDGVMCAWKDTRIGFVIDFRIPDARSAIEATVRIAQVIDAA